MTLDRLSFGVPVRFAVPLRHAVLGAMLLVVAVVLAGCTSMPDPAEPTPPPKPTQQQPAAGKATVKVQQKPTPIVNIHVPDTSVPATLEEYPVQVEIRADKDGDDQAGAVEVLFQQDLLERGISLAAPGKMGHVYSRVLVRLDLTARKVRDLGAGRTQVEGEGNVAVIRPEGNVTIGRRRLSAMSGADSTERVATRQVLDAMCASAADLVQREVTNYAARTHKKVVAVDTASPDLDIDTFCDALEKAIDGEDGLVLVDPRMDRAAKSATFYLWMAPEYEGDLAKLFETGLRESGAGRSFQVEVKVTR